MSDFLQALLLVFNIKTFAFIFFGTFVGIVFGALPGLTAVMGVALLMPLTFFMPAHYGLPMLIAVYCGGIYGGSITAILINTPGTPASAATTLDGYPMAKRGEPGKALSIAVIASGFGGIVSVIVLTFLSPILGKIALAFGPIEYFSLILIGVVLIGFLSSDSIFKSIIAALMGFVLSFIGMDPILGLPRFDFGNYHLFQGISLIPAVIGLFAISEVFVMITNIQTSTDDIKPIKKVTYAKPEVFLRNIKTLIKGSLIGTFIGAVPAVGSSTGGWISYGEAKRASKNQDKFGTGCAEGIIASESANNAVPGGAMIPLLSLGIPGDPVTAVLLGGLIIQGLTPGPNFFLKHADTAYMIFIAFFFSNIVMVLLGLIGVKFFAKVLHIPKHLLATIVMILSLIGCYAINNSIFDIKIAIVLGIFAFLMKSVKVPIAPMVLALVLAPMFEQNLRRAMILTEGSIIPFFQSPVALFFYGLCILLMIGLRKTKNTNFCEKNVKK
jgi:putative tricarboxylic transport membrane protein